MILVTLVGQGLTLPAVVRWAGWDGVELGGDEASMARATAYEAGLIAVAREREKWPDHQPLMDRLQASLEDRMEHLAVDTDDDDQTAERQREHAEHQQIQLAVISAQRNAVIELRDGGQINDETLREVERELDLESCGWKVELSDPGRAAPQVAGTLQSGLAVASTLPVSGSVLLWSDTTRYSESTS